MSRIGGASYCETTLELADIDHKSKLQQYLMPCGSIVKSLDHVGRQISRSAPSLGQ